ncbi:MAG: DedA family protein [Actinomycetes bacterium]|jgi:membrane protein DedA with SNARE-associated domain|nr:DedA family protein [Actinomycetes bacterium]
MTVPNLADLPAVLKPIAPVYLWVAQNFVPWGLILLFFSSAMENWLIIGLLTPGEILIVAGAFIASDIGVSLGIVLGVSVAGSTAGILVAYLLGRKLGVEGLQKLLVAWNGLPRLPRFLKLNRHLVDDLGEYFATHGAVTSFTARFAYGVKAFIPPVAGAAGMNPFAFMATSLLGGALYTTLLIVAGWFLQRNVRLATTILKGLSTFGSVILVALVIFALLILRRIALRRQSRKGRFQAKSAGKDE